jgi:hypothetical protein
MLEVQIERVTPVEPSERLARASAQSRGAAFWQNEIEFTNKIKPQSNRCGQLLRHAAQQRGHRPVAIAGAASILSILDAYAQISLIGKLKLTNCAPISGLLEIGLFCHPTCAWATALGSFNRISYEFETTNPSPP